MAEEEATHHESSGGMHAAGGALKKHWKLLLIIGGGLILFLWWRSRATGSAATVSSPAVGTSTAVTSPVSTVTSPTSTVSTGVGTSSGGQTVQTTGSISPGSRATTSTSGMATVNPVATGGTSTLKTAVSKFTTPKLTVPSGYQQASSYAQAVADEKAGENVLWRNNLKNTLGELSPGFGITPKDATIFVPTTISTAAKALGANSTYSTPPPGDGNYTKFLGTFGTFKQAYAVVSRMNLGNQYMIATNGANASYTVWGP